MEIYEFTKLTPFHKLQVIVTLISFIICLVYFVKEVIREFPMIIKILKTNEEEKIDE